MGGRRRRRYHSQMHPCKIQASIPAPGECTFEAAGRTFHLDPQHLWPQAARAAKVFGLRLVKSTSKKRMIRRGGGRHGNGPQLTPMALSFGARGTARRTWSTWKSLSVCVGHHDIKPQRCSTHSADPPSRITQSLLMCTNLAFRHEKTYIHINIYIYTY